MMMMKMMIYYVLKSLNLGEDIMHFWFVKETASRRFHSCCCVLELYAGKFKKKKKNTHTHTKEKEEEEDGKKKLITFF